ncbi:MAG: hypothetical protein LBB91_01545 [Clostridiales bacterium]|nr:hypothetical protein [Clostridiales bacterium]
MNLLERGREQGIIEGKAEGRAEGKAEGKAESIIELLSDIGEVPDDLHEKILAQNDLAILSKWLRISTKVNSINEFIMQIAS